MKALLGRKIGMSQVFSPNGDVIPVTLVSALPNTITIRRTVEKDGYAAVQLALPKKAGAETIAVRKEFHGEMPADISVVGVDQFSEGDAIEVTGVSKGKGFAGVVKRHHFKGGPKSHGHRHVLRRPGSIGSRFPQHVMKGVRMAGRMGSDQVTVKNLQVVKVDTEHNVIAIKGAVPGRKGGVVEIHSVEKN